LHWSVPVQPVMVQPGSQTLPSQMETGGAQSASPLQLVLPWQCPL
jgi:hypothetical protein